MEKTQMEIMNEEYAKLWNNYDYTVKKLVKSDKEDDVNRWKQQKSVATARLRQHERACKLLGIELLED